MELEQKGYIDLERHNEDYLLARSLVEETGQNVFLTGRAGTGKTTFLKELRERARKRILVLAPTGIAAINAGGATLHSFFQLPFGLYLPGYYRKNRYRIGKEKIDVMQKMELMVIDEVSMLRPDLLDCRSIVATSVLLAVSSCC